MKLLVVEDDRALNQGIALSFGSETVVQAFCLKEAEKLFDNMKFLDGDMPVELSKTEQRLLKLFVQE